MTPCEVNCFNKLYAHHLKTFKLQGKAPKNKINIQTKHSKLNTTKVVTASVLFILAVPSMET
nr:hypothetical protein [uncultured Desulfobacter sp.]